MAWVSAMAALFASTSALAAGPENWQVGFGERGSHIATLIADLHDRVILIGAVIVLIVLGFTLGWWDQLSRWTGAWLVWVLFLILIVALIVVLVGSVLLLRSVIPRYRERRFLTRLGTQEARPPEDEEAASYRQLQEKMQEAIRTLERSPDLKKKGELPLYAVPWYLLIGASQAGKAPA